MRKKQGDGRGLTDIDLHEEKEEDDEEKRLSDSFL